MKFRGVLSFVPNAKFLKNNRSGYPCPVQIPFTYTAVNSVRDLGRRIDDSLCRYTPSRRDPRKIFVSSPPPYPPWIAFAGIRPRD